MQIYFIPTVNSVTLLVARRTNDRKIAGSRPTKVVCIETPIAGNSGQFTPAWRWTAHCFRPPLLLPSCKKLEFRLSTLMNSNLKSGRQRWRYADAF